MNEGNLKPFTSEQSREQAVANGRKGGIASGEEKRRRRDLRLALEALLDREFQDKKTGLKMSGTEVITSKLFEKAAKGDVKAFETIRSTVGQDPVQKVMIAEVDQEVIDEVEKAVLEDDEETGN